MGGGKQTKAGIVQSQDGAFLVPPWVGGWAARLRHNSACLGVGGHEATDTGLAYAPVSQAHGLHHSVQCSASLHRGADRFCTTPGGL